MNGNEASKFKSRHPTKDTRIGRIAIVYKQHLTATCEIMRPVHFSNCLGQGFFSIFALPSKIAK
jgi:hypothetical protein